MPTTRPLSTTGLSTTGLLATSLLATGALTLALAAPARAHENRCAPAPGVPGAQKQVAACLDDLTTAGTVASGHTVPGDYAGLHASGTRNPSGVPGVQIDGYFPDDSAFNTHHGWNHDAQFVIRLPERWNGGLVVAGSPGNRRQYANDATVSDWVLGRGYAYAATDKGNSGTEFHRDGRRPGDAVAEWNRRLTELTRAAQRTAERHYGRRPSRTYAAGISNGGYLVRWQLENRPHLYDGGIDAEGTLWRADGPNLFTYLPPILRAYPPYAAGDASAHRALLDAGLAAGSEFLWPYHDQVYWELTQRIYREEFDPAYTGAEAEYNYASRPREVRRAVGRVSLTGRIRKPLISLQGTYDALLPIGRNGDAYAALVRDRGRAPFRYYRVAGANHTDGLVDAHPGRLRPLLPCMRSAFTALETWTSGGGAPPPSATLPEPSGDVLNTCSLTG
ncbi:3-hydroxybutyrate oligomer hydrolase family protein [Actinomadura rifamycini]|uniref:3-hydroxybutyrate oligomer hydrolase family protein n=1 Tax=Actinomadura rifamycini TaxID=31962 RepID=UPI0003F80797|nr:tannase/feruloyl esterase family alpha/beta hydrolase [Actinomadura rifamycini]